MGDPHDEETRRHQGLPRETFQEPDDHETPGEEGRCKGREIVHHRDGIQLQIQSHHSRDNAIDHTHGEDGR